MSKIKRGIFCFPSKQSGDEKTRRNFRYSRILRNFDIDSITVDTETEYNELPKFVNDFKPDFLMYARRRQLIEPLIKIKKLFPDVSLIGWLPDARKNLYDYAPFVIELYDLADLFLCKTRGSVEKFQNVFKQCKDVRWWPEGSELGQHDRREPTAAAVEKYGHDVIFMGARRGFPYTTPEPGGRIRLIQHIKNKGIDLKLVAYNEQGSGKIGGGEWSMACNAAKIVLGHCGLADVSCSNPQRDFRVIASGGFLLTEHVLDCELLFKVGEEIVTYTTADDCVDKIRYYLEHEEERKVIQDAGYESRFRHSIIDRFKEFLCMVEEVKSCQHS